MKRLKDTGVGYGRHCSLYPQLPGMLLENDPQLSASVEMSSAKGHSLTPGHASFPGQLESSNQSVWEYNGPIAVPQLETARKGCPDCTATQGSAGAPLGLHCSLASSSAQSYFILLSSTSVDSDSTPQYISSTLISNSRFASEETQLETIRYVNIID